MPFLIELTWPASAGLITATVVYLACRIATNPWGVAAKSVAVPAMIGFGVLATCLGWFNASVSPDEERIRSFELFVLRASHVLPSWTRLAVWQLVLVMVALIWVNRTAPDARVVTRVLKTRKAASRVSAVLAVLASLTFFTNDAILGKMASAAAGHVTARFRDSLRKERDAIGRYLVARVQQQVVAGLVPAERDYVAQMVVRIDTDRVLSTTGKAAAALELARGYFGPAPMTSAISEQEASRLAREAPPSLLTEPAATLDTQVSNAAAANRVADLEEKKAIETVLSGLIGAAAEPAKDVARTFFREAFTFLAPPLVNEAGAYLGTVADKTIEARTKPLVQRYATTLQARLRRADGSARDAVGDVEGNVTRVVTGWLEEGRRLARQLQQASRGAAAAARLTAEQSLQGAFGEGPGRDAMSDHLKAQLLSERLHDVTARFDETAPRMGGVVADLRTAVEAADARIKAVDAIRERDRDFNRSPPARLQERDPRVERERLR